MDEMRAGQNGFVMPTKRRDEPIDFSDIPEITDEQWSGAVRGVFARPETRHISIRLSAANLLIANKPVTAKGLPYQTYIKRLLHESLLRESSK